jgi:hypothetical protein
MKTPISPAFAAAFTYAVMFSFGAYNYCRLPQNDARNALQTAQLIELKQTEKSLMLQNKNVKQEIHRELSGYYHYKKVEESASKTQELCAAAKTKLSALQLKISTASLTESDQEKQFFILKSLYDSLENQIDSSNRKDWKERVEGRYFDKKMLSAFAKNTALSFQLLRNHISTITFHHLNYLLNIRGILCYGPSENYLLLPQLDKYSLHEGERLRGKAGLAVIPWMRHDSLYINKKRYLSEKGMVKYTAPPQPSGRYSLIVSGKQHLKKPTGQDTIFRICDTLYYYIP